MLKQGPSERRRGVYCETLGRHICPEIYGYTEHGYVMEYLVPAFRYDLGLLKEIEAALKFHIWPQETVGFNWLPALRRRVRVPDPPPHQSACWTHGDCTVSNAMRREGGGLVMVDPLPPQPHVANAMEADMGRILQSAVGWEVLMYGDAVVEWEPPMFWHHDGLRSAALWWCGATARRIELGETRQPVLDWCAAVAERCFDEYRV